MRRIRLHLVTITIVLACCSSAPAQSAELSAQSYGLNPELVRLPPPTVYDRDFELALYSTKTHEARATSADAATNMPDDVQLAHFSPHGDCAPTSGTLDGCDQKPCCDLGPFTEPCPTWSINGILGYESFRGHPDGGWGNWGLHTGFNFGTRLGEFGERTGIGAQIGGTIGAFDWSGTDYRLQNKDKVETQGMITFGLFRKASATSRLGGAIVQDWMINDTFGVFGEDPTMYQWRAQIGYAASDFDEIGVWGAWRGQGATRNLPYFGSTTWRPINQINAFCHHKWGTGGADTWIWLGIPERDRLAGGGSLGDYLVGARADCPLNDCWTVYSLVTYMHPSASPGPAAAKEEAWSWSIGITLYPAHNARARTVAGRRWTPYLPVATNGYFLVDTNNVY
ncbi:MAG: hypothetical protein KDA63_13570 [Planctomycetales bacterium]|nr:hypothetical protein [Planctomycetales bacterium]